VSDQWGIKFQDSFRTRARIHALNENAGNARGSLVFETGFSTDTIERVRINSDGKVGIGTDAPDSLLEVSSATDTVIKSTAVGDYFPSLNIERTNGSSKTDYQWKLQLGSGGDLNFQDVTNSWYPLIFNTSGDLYLGNDTSGANPTMFIDQSTGEVGIGTNNPSYLLHLYAASAPTLRIQDTTNNCYLDLRANDDSVLIRSTANYPMIFDGQIIQ